MNMERWWFGPMGLTSPRVLAMKKAVTTAPENIKTISNL
jgi:hypothetical protein